ncbi:MAG: UTP--glucose-1-phosphate uridylyltransferase GalU [Candidatus Bipolaricaulia bacterium]
MKVRKAVIPAAGLGTRFLPATKAMPKEMLPLVDKPAIQYVVEEAVASGIETILIITGRGKRAIEDHFDYSPELEAYLQERGDHHLAEIIRKIPAMAHIHYLRQKEPKGLGHAVLCAARFVGDEPFAVLLGDDLIESDPPCLKQMLDIQERLGGSIVAVREVVEAEVRRYGIIKGQKVDERLYRVEDLVEKPRPSEAPSRLAVIGRYILSPAIFGILSETPPGVGGEVQLTDGLRRLCRIEPMHAYLFEGERYDIGDKLGYLKAIIEMALRHEDVKDELSRYISGLNEKIKGPGTGQIGGGWIIQQELLKTSGIREKDRPLTPSIPY